MNNLTAIITAGWLLLASNGFSAQQPEIAKRLRAKLDTWLATLKRPGPPQQFLRDGGYFEAKMMLPKPDKR